MVTDLGVSGWDRLSLPAVGEYDPTVPVKIVTVGPAETPPSGAAQKAAPLNGQLNSEVLERIGYLYVVTIMSVVWKLIREQ